MNGKYSLAVSSKLICRVTLPLSYVGERATHSLGSMGELDTLPTVSHTQMQVHQVRIHFMFGWISFLSKVGQLIPSKQGLGPSPEMNQAPAETAADCPGTKLIELRGGHRSNSPSGTSSFAAARQPSAAGLDRKLFFFPASKDGEEGRGGVNVLFGQAITDL